MLSVKGGNGGGLGWWLTVAGFRMGGGITTGPIIIKYVNSGLYGRSTI